MNYHGRKVVVTGAGGFIGSHLTEALLEKGARVTAFVHYNSRHSYGWLEGESQANRATLSVVLGDIRDGNAMRKLIAGNAVVFHLAALIGIPYSYMGPETYLETNVKGTLNVLQAALDAKAERIIHTSTSEVYGTGRYVPIDEEHPLQAQSPYSASKIGADKLAESYWRSFALPVVTVRPFNTYGPRQSARAVIPTIITQALQGMEVRLGSLEPVRDSNAMRKLVAGNSLVFHLAALIGIPYSYMAPEAYVETNIKGTLNVLQAGLETKVERVVHTSTSEVYGTARYIPIDEEHPLQGQSPYSASKIGADKLAESYFRSFELPVVTVRPFNTYGPRQSARAVIPTIISQALQGKEVRLGSLRPVRDMTFVNDTVRGFIAAGENKAIIGETINLGTGEGVSIQELVETISEVMDREITIISEEERLRPSNSEVFKLISCATKAKKLMNWQAQIGLKEGLTKTVAWISENRKSYKESKFVY